MLMFLCFLMAYADLPVVENGLMPAGESGKFTLQEDLRIGPDSDDRYTIWSGPYLSFDVNAKGHIFVADDRENRIVEFNPEGKFVRQIGRPGPGPGEFQGLININFLADGSCVAVESFGQQATLNFYDASMTFLRERKIVEINGLTNYIQAPWGDYSFVTYATPKAGQNKMEKGSVLFKDTENVRQIIAVDVLLFNQSRANEPQFWSEFIADQLKQNARGLIGFAAFSASQAFTAVGHKYEITIWDKAMNKQKIIRRKYKPIIRTEEEINAQVDPIKNQLNAQLPPNMAAIITPGVIRKAIDLVGFPPGKSPINGLIALEGGGFLVLHNQNRSNGLGQADVFDAEGKYQGNFTHPQQGLGRMSFKNGFAYTTETDMDGEQYLVRYRTW